MDRMLERWMDAICRASARRMSEGPQASRDGQPYIYVTFIVCGIVIVCVTADSKSTLHLYREYHYQLGP
jgi:hypothetical protein